MTNSPVYAETTVREHRIAIVDNRLETGEWWLMVLEHEVLRHIIAAFELKTIHRYYRSEIRLALRHRS